MKTNTLTARLLSLVALLLVIVMAFSACGETKGNESDAANADVNSANDNADASAKDTASDNKDGSSKSKNTTSKSKNTTSKKTGNNASTGPVNLTDYANIPASVKEKGVHVLMWRPYTETEQKQVDDFQSKTGIKVRTTVTTESEYSTKLISLISGKDSPDVVCMGSTNFPGLTTKSLQPLDENKFNLNDSAWYKPYMDAYSVGGKFYAAAMRGSWSVEDCNYVTYYNPDVLKECGVTQMPYDLYKQGNWNWAKQKEIALAVANKGGASGELIGLSTQGYDIFMLSAGLDFVSYDPVKSVFTNNIDTQSSEIISAWTQMADLTAAHATSNLQFGKFAQGQVGMLTGIIYGLYTNGWFKPGVDTIQNIAQAVPVAGPTQSSAYTPVRPKCWGVPKGAKNIDGAAYFIRYYLDPKTINMSSTFHNKQFEEVFNIITSESAKKHIMRGEGIVDYVSSGTYSKVCNALNASTAANLNTELNKYKGNIKTALTRANKDLARAASK